VRCARCEHENSADQKYCGECGARLATACPACGAVNAAAQKFCGECGAPLSQADAPPKFAAPESYTPKHLADKILISRNALEGERKQITILFADIKGSLELIEGSDPEQAHLLLDSVIAAMMDAVHRCEGTVNRVQGDGIMALFGAPLAHEDHAVRACYAALAMQDTIRRAAEKTRLQFGVEPQIRVGLNSGEVVVRGIGNDLSMDYDAIGPTAHLAGRMEQLAIPGTIRLTQNTLHLAEGFVRVNPLGPVPVKGLKHPIEIFELVGATPTRSRFQAAIARGLTRFVGRDRELEALGRALSHAAHGQGQVLAVVGEPGVGKSRLFYEFMHSHRTTGALILESRSVSYGKATAYLPVIGLLKAYCQVEERDDLRSVREKVTGKLLTLDEGLKITLPAVLSLLDVPVDDPVWTGMEPSQRRRRTLEAIKAILLRESQVQPLVIVFEDLHWVDNETQTFLDSLVESIPTARVLMLVNYRPEYQHPWGSKTYYAQRRIDALPPENTDQLLRDLLGDDPSLIQLKALLVKRGNPFFLEETVRTLVETESLEGEPGAYRLIHPVQALQIPSTVQTVLAARIDRLPAEDKQLLQAASVVGKDVPYAILQAIANLPEDALRRGLADLQDNEFLYEARLFPDLEYTFKHALTHEVTYGSLLAERRRALHEQIAKAVERLYSDRLAEHVERLAHHAVRGELWEKAVTYLRQAGAKLFARSAFREAVTQFEQALAGLGHLPENRETLELAIDVRFELRNSLMPLGELELLRNHLRKAETIAEVLGDQRRLGQAFMYLVNYYVSLGDHGLALEYAQRALAIAETHGDFATRIVAHFRVGQAHHSLGDYRQAAEFLQRATADLQGDLIQEHLGMAGFPSAISRAYLAWCLGEAGEFSKGILVAEEALRIADAMGQAFTLASVCFCVGCLYLRKGDIRTAIAVLNRGRQVCRDHEVPIYSPMIGSQLGYAYAVSGRADEALPLLEQIRKQATDTQGALYPRLSIAFVANAYLWLGRIDDAAKLGAVALHLCRQRKERGHEAWALHFLGAVAFHADPPDVKTAERHYGDALALSEELGMRPLVAHCHLGLGRLHQRAGKQREAEEHMATALAMYRDMDMRFWLEQANAEVEALR